MSDTTTRTRAFFARRYGTSEEWQRFVDKYERRMYGLCMHVRSGRTAQDYEDAVQEALTRVFKAMESGTAWDPSVGKPLHGWLFVLTCNALTDVLRRSLKADLLPPEALDNEVAAVAHDITTAEMHELILAELAELLREHPLRYLCFRLRVLEDWNPRDIAREINLPVATVSRHIYCAKEALRQVLRELGHDDLLPKSKTDSDPPLPESPP